MVSWFFKTVVIIHLTHVLAQYTPSVLPPLLDATADELIAGLDAGHFTSLNLVEVRHLSLLIQ
jgi:amidase